MNMKRFFLIFLLALAILPARAQTALELIREEPHLAFGNMYPYHPMDTLVSEAPKGYEAFYISHFGRHGSRYDYEIDSNYKVLATMADHYNNGRLTERGEQLYRDILAIRKATEGHYGDLTALGAREHREIASRMYRHYPGVFGHGKKIDTYTTMVPRVIESRDNFLSTLTYMCPEMDVSLNYSKDSKWALQEVAGRSMTKEESKLIGRDETISKVREELFLQLDGSRFAAEIFKNPADAGNARMLMYQILSATKTVACLDEDLPDISEYFTAEELYHMWNRSNIVWYTRHGITPDNEGLRAEIKGRLIAQAIIEDAQEAIASKGKIAATLRFSHDGDLNPLLSFLNIEGTNCTDLYQMAEQARDFEIVRTGANLQLVFYRNAKGDILVKALRNEMETHIVGVKPYKGFYYRWKDVRRYWENRVIY